MGLGRNGFLRLSFLAENWKESKLTASPHCPFPAPNGVWSPFHMALGFSQMAFSKSRVPLLCLSLPLPRFTAFLNSPWSVYSTAIWVLVHVCQLSASLDICLFIGLQIPCHCVSCQLPTPFHFLCPHMCLHPLQPDGSLLLSSGSVHSHLRINTCMWKCTHPVLSHIILTSHQAEGVSTKAGCSCRPAVRGMMSSTSCLTVWGSHSFLWAASITSKKQG